MKLSKEGKLSWDVPKDLKDDMVFIIVSVITAEDSIFHTLKLKVSSK